MTIIKRAQIKRALAATAAGAVMATAAHAAPITITVTNNQDVGGLTLTPLYFAFTDGAPDAFDAFDVGEAASAGVEEIAELGSFGTLAGERNAADPDALGAVLAAPGGFAGAPVIEPGETASITIDIDPTSQRFVQFLSMIVPSNDTFVGIDDAVALFSEDGTFLGPQVFDLTSAFAYDAGTEVNDPMNGAAFVQGVNEAEGEEEGGVISLATDIGMVAGIVAATGQELSPEAVAAFFGGGVSLATISIDAAPVPVPAAALLFGTALAGAAGVRRRQSRRRDEAGAA